MTTETHKVISLSAFAERAIEGEAIEQELSTGERVEVRVHAPDQKTLLRAQGLMVRIVQVADAARNETEISDDDATLAYELGVVVLTGCVRDENGETIPDAAVVDLFRKLPYKSEVMSRCQELCGVDMITVPPVSNSVAIKAVREEAAELVADAKAKSNPNRKTRRAAASKAKPRQNFERMRDDKERAVGREQVGKSP